MMPKLVMPRLGRTIEEATIVRWLKREGDPVQEGELVAVVSTDKANFELPVEDSGVLRRILVEQGDTVPIGSTLAFVDTGSGDLPQEVDELPTTSHDLTYWEDQVLHATRSDRLTAIKYLKAAGAEGVSPLCRALQDRAPDVQFAAVEALAEVGDERAIEPLTNVICVSLGGRSGRSYRWLGLAAAGLLVLLVLAVFAGATALKMGAALAALGNMVWRCAAGYFEKRRQNSPLVRVVTQALTRIAERNPTPRLRPLVEDLRAIAADRIQQEAATREASRAAAARIEELTEQVKNLPVAAAEGEMGTASLPVISAPATEAAENLPRVRH